ncbi:MAG: TetR/AcrR family transcriptional regulator [Planctomycetota bacterium]|nr:MAG: TetR/AcrR family transcriptional regulator [Planctomycetota bacterium]
MSRPAGELRRAILDEARKSLLERGYTALSMRKIASAVGCTATSIYLYFDNKDALIHALIDEGFEQLNQVLTQATEGLEANQSAEARMRHLAYCYFRFGEENPEYYEIMFMLHPTMMERYPAENYRRARRNLELFAEALTLGMPEGTARQIAAKSAATLLWTSLHGCMSLLIAQRIDVRLDRRSLVDEAVEHAVSLVTRFRQAETIGSDPS